MNDEKKRSGKVALGCLLCLWSAFVTTPMWMVMLYVVLDAVKVPSWTWTIYWAYCPAVILGVAISGIGSYMTGGDR